jgi:hypothetical protein
MLLKPAAINVYEYGISHMLVTNMMPSILSTLIPIPRLFKADPIEPFDDASSAHPKDRRRGPKNIGK